MRIGLYDGILPGHPAARRRTSRSRRSPEAASRGVAHVMKVDPWHPWTSRCPPLEPPSRFVRVLRTTVRSSRSIVRHAFEPVFNEMKRRPASPSFVHCCPRTHLAGLQVDIAPPQSQQLPASHPRSQRQLVQSVLTRVERRVCTSSTVQVSVRRGGGRSRARQGTRIQRRQSRTVSG